MYQAESNEKAGSNKQTENKKMDISGVDAQINKLEAIFNEQSFELEKLKDMLKTAQEDYEKITKGKNETSDTLSGKNIGEDDEIEKIKEEIFHFINDLTSAIEKKDSLLNEIKNNLRNLQKIKQLEQEKAQIIKEQEEEKVNEINQGIGEGNILKIEEAIEKGVRPTKNTLDLAIEFGTQSVIEAVLKSKAIQRELTIDRFIELIQNSQEQNIMRLIYCDNFRLSSLVFVNAVVDPFEQLKIIATLNKTILEKAIERDAELKEIIECQNKKAEIFDVSSKQAKATAEPIEAVTLTASCGLLQSDVYSNKVLATIGQVVFGALKKQLDVTIVSNLDENIAIELGRMSIDSWNGKNVICQEGLAKALVLFCDLEEQKLQTYPSTCPLTEFGIFSYTEENELNAYVEKYQQKLTKFFDPSTNFSANRDERLIRGRNTSSILSKVCQKLQDSIPVSFESKEKESPIEYFSSYAKDGGLTECISQLNLINFYLTDFVSTLQMSQ